MVTRLCKASRFTQLQLVWALRERWHDPMPQYFTIITLLFKCTKPVKHITNECLNLSRRSLTQSSGSSEGPDTPIRRHCRVNSTLFPLVPSWNMWPATHLASPPRCICSAWYTELCTSLLLWKSGSCPLQSPHVCSIIQNSVLHHIFPGSPANRGACVNYIHTHIHTYMHTYIHTHIHTVTGTNRWPITKRDFIRRHYKEFTKFINYIQFDKLNVE